MADRLLLHICCGPCASATYQHWQNEGIELVGFFYNPNIQPFLEFKSRLEGVRSLSDHAKMPLFEDLAYDPEWWFAQVGSSLQTRCEICIGLRMERAAREAAARKCKVFSTSLSISPWQDHEAIKVQGRKAATKHGVEFIYRDLRPLYKESRRLSREWGLYQQKYCGCIVSEWERYREVKK